MTKKWSSSSASDCRCHGPLGAGKILTGSGIDLDRLALGQIFGNLKHVAGFKRRGFRTTRGRITPHARIALRDFEFDRERQLDPHALLLIDDAMGEISQLRATLGAFQKNTLQSNTKSLRVAEENLTSAESSLRDADMAAEMTNFTRNQVMLAAGTAMLAQANQSPEAVLRLLTATVSG